MRKNINPKTLKGQDKLNRIKDLMGRMNTLDESTSLSELELIKKGPNGVTYGIIRENHDYFIKTSNKTSGALMAEDFKYVGGLQNKYDERYKSYSEALKHLNMKFDMLNESYGIDNNTNLFESDGVAFGGGVGFGFVMEEDEDEDGKNEGKQMVISDGDEMEEQKKVLKVDAPKAEEPVEDEVEDEVEIDDSGDAAEVEFDDEEDMGDDEEDMGDEEEDMGDEEEGDDNTKKIQKYTGKIGQMLRDMDEADSDLEKYVINSIISAMHLDDMDEEDKEDIIAKLEGEDDEEGEDEFGDEEDMGDEDVDVDLDDEEDMGDDEEDMGDEEELSESEDKDDDDDDDDDDDEKEVVTISEKQMKMLHEDGICTCDDETCLVYPNAENADAEEILEKMEKEETCIVISEKRMKMLHKKGKCDCGDVTLKYKEGKKEKNEGRVFSKKQLIESFLRRETKKSLSKVLRERRELCQDCGNRMVEGMCMECGMNEHHMGRKASYDRYPYYDKEAYILHEGEMCMECGGMLEEGMCMECGLNESEIMYEKLHGGQKKLDVAKPYGKLTKADFDKLRSDKTESRRDRRRYIDEEMDVMDAIATGQGYLDATGDLDRDFDGIPNRLDMDNNDDGELDFAMGRNNRYRSIGDDSDDFIELDIDFLRNSGPGTKERERTTTTPTTTPGKKNPWETIKRPKVDPRPKAEMDRPRPSYRRRGMFR